MRGRVRTPILNLTQRWPGTLSERGGRTEKRKARTDGDDVLTPLAQKAAEAIADAVAKWGTAR